MNRMDCREVREQLSAYHDDELQDSGRRIIAAHLEGCASCRQELDALVSMSARMHTSGTYAVPAAFEAKLLDHLGIADAENGRARKRYALAASHLAAACLGALILYGALGRSDTLQAAARDAMTAYARALMSEQGVQIASSDQHTVRPWFASRVPFSPPVRDVMADEFPLLGGRVDRLGGRDAAVTVYGRRKHKIDVFAQPRDATAISAALDLSRNGYAMISWYNGDFAYLAISDLNAAELKQFIETLRANAH